MEIILGVLCQGMIYSIMALGVYITYKILDFPDMTADGTFPLGAAVSTMMLTQGVGSGWTFLTLLASFAAGAMAGMLTGLIHVKCKVRDLLAGIIMMTALYTVNLRICGKANVPLFSTETIFSNSTVDSIFERLLPSSLSKYESIIIIMVILILCKLLLDLYMKTKSGYLLRATGDNATLVTSLAKDKGLVKILGLSLANGLVALSGSMMAQYQRFFDITMGTGTVIIGLASVIMAANLLKNIPVIKNTTTIIIGAIIYRGVWAAVIVIGMDAKDMKFITAALLLIFLIISMERKKKVKMHA